MLETWSDVDVPVLIVGLGALLIGTVLPWLTDGWGTDRRVRGVLVLGGVLVCGVALWPAVQSLGATAPGVVVKTPGVPQVEFSYNECLAKLNEKPDESKKSSPQPQSQPQSQSQSQSQSDPWLTAGLVSGASTGLYHALANNLVQLVQQNPQTGLGKLVLVNRQTLGSKDNLSKLVNHKEDAAVGFVQSDLMDWLRKSSEPKDREQAELLRLVLPLHAEEVHVLSRRTWRTLSDLSGKRVLTPVGSQGSGYTAETLLRAANVQVQIDDTLSQMEAVCEVITGKAAAVVIVHGKPVQSLLRLNKLSTDAAQPLNGVHLMSLGVPPGLVGYEAAKLDANDYAWLPEPVNTLSVQALLMAVDFSAQRTARQKRRCAQVKALAALVKAKVSVLQGPPYDPKWREINPLRVVDGWKPVGDCSK